MGREGKALCRTDAGPRESLSFAGRLDHGSAVTPDLAILYEHPLWFKPLFAALDRRGVAWAAIRLTDHRFDPADRNVPAPVVLSRVAMSGFLRDPEHGIFYARSLLAHWQANGARVLNGPEVLSVDSSKARQLSLIAGLGLAIPETRVVHRREDILAAAEGMAFPLLLKANVGGSGAGIVRYDDHAALAEAVAERFLPGSVDSVLLVQDYVPAEGGRIIRLETLGGRFLYAIEVETGEGFDLCPADACIAAPGREAIRMAAVEPGPDLVDAAERIARAVGLDVGGIEVVIDARDGVPRFYDINALSNFIANPLDVLGWDPHERLVDYLEAAIAEAKR
jgi:glutathione synthase/RimK-type ligase-like ATP-grasp enzyme